MGIRPDESGATKITRRRFFGLLACFGTLSRRAMSSCDDERIPGEIIRVPWPFFIDSSRARVIVLRDGIRVGNAPVRLCGKGRALLVEAKPPLPVAPGRYEFVLATGLLRVPLGGFRIARHFFGC